MRRAQQEQVTNILSYVSNTDSTTIPTTNSNTTTNPCFDAAATTTVSKFP